MAEKRTRGTQNFSYDKPKNRRFDFTKDSDAPEETSQNGTSLTDNPNGGDKRRLNWLLCIAAGIVIIAIAFFGYKNCSGSDAASIVPDSIKNEKSDTTGAEKSDTIGAEKQQGNAGETNVPTTDDGTPKPYNGGTEAEKPEQKPAPTPKIVDEPVAPAAPVSGSVEENARRVIRGDFGNGKVRKDKLGASYSEIQSRVNEMYRQGLVK